MNDFLKNKAKIEDAMSNALMLAKQQGANSAEVTVNIGAGFSVAVRLGEIETIEHHQDKSMEITVYFDQRVGTVSTADLRPDSLRLAVEKATNIAKYTSEDPCAGLADRDLMAFNYPDLDLYHPWNISPEKGGEIALQCERLAQAEDKRITNSEGATVDTYDSLHFYANSHGFTGFYPISRHSLGCALIANDGHGMQRDHDYTTARDPQDLADPASVAKKVAQRTVNRLGAKRLSTRRCPVIYTPEIARSLLGHFLAAISGGNLYRNTSFLLNQLHHKIFPDYINIVEQPHVHKAIGSAPFDNEGVRTKEKDLIRKGVLQSYILGSYSARKLGMQSTGNAGRAFNVILNSTGKTFSGMLAEMNTGLLITELMGNGLNLVTGDYSRGAFGYWVENGEIQYPVQEITVAGNLKEMFAGIIVVGNDIDHRGNIQTGSILIEHMTIAGE